MRAGSKWCWRLKLFNREGESIHDDLYVSESDALERLLAVCNGTYGHAGHVGRMRGVRGELYPSAAELWSNQSETWAGSGHASWYADSPRWVLKRGFKLPAKGRQVSLEGLLAGP